MVKNGGLITLEDLKAYKPIWADSHLWEFSESENLLNATTFIGGVHLLQILNIIGDTD